jgi:hypothetical protein
MLISSNRRSSWPSGHCLLSVMRYSCILVIRCLSHESSRQHFMSIRQGLLVTVKRWHTTILDDPLVLDIRDAGGCSLVLRCYAAKSFSHCTGCMFLFRAGVFGSLRVAMFPRSYPMLKLSSSSSMSTFGWQCPGPHSSKNRERIVFSLSWSWLRALLEGMLFHCTSVRRRQSGFDAKTWRIPPFALEPQSAQSQPSFV